MKTLSMIGIIAVIVLTFGFTTGGSGKYQTSNSNPGLTIEKALPSGVNTNAITRPEQTAPENSIFSWSTIISLGVAVIGIVAFRRNTYY